MASTKESLECRAAATAPNAAHATAAASRGAPPPLLVLVPPPSPPPPSAEGEPCEAAAGAPVCTVAWAISQAVKASPSAGSMVRGRGVPPRGACARSGAAATALSCAAHLPR